MATPALARERDDHADLESADAAPRELWESELSIDDLADEIRERAKRPLSESIDRDTVVAEVMATIRSFRK